MNSDEPSPTVAYLGETLRTRCGPRAIMIADLSGQRWAAGAARAMAFASTSSTAASSASPCHAEASPPP